MFTYFLGDSANAPATSNYIKNGFSLTTNNEIKILPNSTIIYRPLIVFDFYSDHFVYFKIDPQYSNYLYIKNNILTYENRKAGCILEIINKTNRYIQINKNMLLFHIGLGYMGKINEIKAELLKDSAVVIETTRSFKPEKMVKLKNIDPHYENQNNKQNKLRDRLKERQHSKIESDSITEPVVEPVTEPVVEPVTEPVVEPVTESVVEPVTEPVVEPVTEPVVEPVTEPVVELVAEPVVELVTEPIAEPKFEPNEQIESESKLITEQVNEQVNKPVIESEAKAITEPATTEQKKRKYIRKKHK